MAENIYIDPTAFQTAINQCDQKCEQFESAAIPLMDKLYNSVTDENWKNAQRETFEYGIMCMDEVLSQCSRNYYYLANLLKQVQMDFQQTDEEIADEIK